VTRFRQRLDAHGIKGVELTQCDVLQLDACPVGWKDYDLVVSASMLEYVSRDRFVTALGFWRRSPDHQAAARVPTKTFFHFFRIAKSDFFWKEGLILT